MGRHAYSSRGERGHAGSRLLPKLNAEWDFLTMLRDEGRKAADAFLQAHLDEVGKVSSLDLDELLEGV